ncbi:MAG: MAPEG family protein [Pseudomonadota bacterium]
MYITPIFAGFLALIYCFLAMRVISARRSLRVGFGDGGERRLVRAIRVHGNFSEYVPFILILMMMGELMSAPAWVTFAIGIVLVSGRLVHAAGVSRQPEPPGSRTIGMGLTLTALLAGAIVTLLYGFSAAP